MDSLFIKDVIFIAPTDTVYGLCGSAFSKKAVEKIFDIKNRNNNKPLIILLANWKQVSLFNIIISQQQKNIIKNISLSKPNKAITFILPCPHKRFAYLHRDTNSLAFRVPDNNIIQKIIRKLGPIVAPSSNPEGLSPATTIRKSQEYFSDKVDLYIDGGVCSKSPSMIVSLMDEKCKVLRG